MPFATVDGLRLHYERHGDSGEALVFIHGFTGDSTDWRFQVAEFSPSYRVLVLDNRGHGRSEAPSDRAVYTVERMTADAEQVIAQVGFERYHLVGHSMGGAVAQEIALRSPERLLSLTLQDTTCWAADHDQPGGTLPYAPPELIARAAARIATMSRDAVAGAWQGLLTWEGTLERAQRIKTPTLIIHGDRDASRIIEGSQRLKELIPQATVEVVEGAGHSPQQERPEAYNAALRRFLESAAARGA